MVPISDVPIVSEPPLTPAQVLMGPAPEPPLQGQVQEPADIEALDPAAEALLWFG